MVQQRKQDANNTSSVLVALVAVLAVVLVSLLVMALLLPGLNGEGETGSTGATETTVATEGSTGATETTAATEESTGATQEPTEETTLPPPSQGVLASDPSVTPDYGKYIDVGSGYIAEIISQSAETFNGSTVDDYSHPTNNYLPKGTVDYCDMDPVTLGKLNYAVLRSGQRVYTKKMDNPTANYVQVIKQYEGTLPDHNEIGFVSMKRSGRHTVLTLDCLWKAPFYFDLKPQSYYNASTGGDRNYSVTAFTAEYIDITFCYATQFTGTVTLPGDSQLFKKVELFSRESDCTLRLHLQKRGGFYGWDAYYNDNGQLCFQFLEPAQVSKADNAIGADLSGVKIVIDVGHGGFDPGTVATLKGQEIHEADWNLVLAKKLRQELEAAGATVVMLRETDVVGTVEDRVARLRQEAPDYCISIHHNSIAGYPDHSGFETFYYTPYSMTAAKKILDRTDESGLYVRETWNWFIFFLSRQTLCPSVLTENGYMSCEAELEKITDDSYNAQKAHAMALAIADYFLEISRN